MATTQIRGQVEQYAGDMMGKVGAVYDQNKDKVNKKVVEPLTLASDSLLESAERAVDAYLPSIKRRRARSVSQDAIEDEGASSPEPATRYERSRRLATTLGERVQERIYDTYLFVASVVLFLIAEACLFGTEVFRTAVIFFLATGLRFIKAPRDTVLQLVEKGQRTIYSGAHLVLYPSELVRLGLEVVLRLIERINANLQKHEDAFRNRESNQQKSQ
eukprot:TRINITY_DN2614_c0_g1_i1.p1 TRINITY_DN2614_c0_g1~~TRINITY_DN2614_c0_g1_i1.p1  ORF type:complete len:217 (-),score=66.82 TRINITY_DN2614_c0_g1_i1:83-733(-)